MVNRLRRGAIEPAHGFGSISLWGFNQELEVRDPARHDRQKLLQSLTAEIDSLLDIPSDSDVIQRPENTMRNGGTLEVNVTHQ